MSMASGDFPLVYRWKLPGYWGPEGSPLFGKRCRQVAQGAKNSVMVEFEGGKSYVVSRHAVRPWKESSQRSLFD